MTEEQTQRRSVARPGWRAVAIATGAAVTGTAALVALREPAAPAPRLVATLDDAAPQKAATDPLMAELIRCRLLPAGSDDAGCREAWEVNRRRFMGESRSYVAPAATAAEQER